MTCKTLPGKTGPDHIFAIGDVHGQAATLEVALNAIAKTPDEGRRRHLVFTGDIIDRGPENLRCIEMVMSAAELARVDRVDFIVGNHELMFLEAISSPHWSMNLWAQNGGIAVIEECDPDGSITGIEAAAELLKERLSDFIDFLQKAKNHLFIEDLLFVHAGIHPHLDIQEFLALGRDEVSDDHWAWIRQPFLSWQKPWQGHPDLTVVHGHTPHNFGAWVDPDEADHHFDLVQTNHRICLDAGAMSKGQLVLLDIKEGAYRLTMQYGPDAGLSMEFGR